MAWRDVAEWLAPCRVRCEPGGVTLARPGARDPQLVWLVLEGRLAVRVGSAEADPIAELTVGDCAGEIAAIDGGLRSAWVVTKGPVRLVEMEAEVFRRLIQGSHAVTLNLVHQLTSRIRNGNLVVQDTVKQQEASARSLLRDSLTGLFNRRWIDEGLPKMVWESRQRGIPLCVVVFDIDHFKQFNDQHGHSAGDQVLVAVSHLLQRRIRPHDHVARMGGEEFLAVLRADLRGAMSAADRIRGALAYTGIGLQDGTEVRVTLSGGVAELRDGEGATGLLDRADRALYVAKSQGRDRVVAANDDDVASP